MKYNIYKIIFGISKFLLDEESLHFILKLTEINSQWRLKFHNLKAYKALRYLRSYH